jgi:ATP-binding cassette, subfamily B, bacterial MsbA
LLSTFARLLKRMKIYFRLLHFARPLGKFAIPYVIFTILTVIFSTLNLALIAPLLATLFNSQSATHIIPPKPTNYFEIFKVFNYYGAVANEKYGIYGTLEYVCLVIIISVFLGNLFRYFSERTMENLRIHTLFNLRKEVFNNVMKLDLRYFNNERKGDIISKVASDVQVVQYSVTGSLQVFFKEPLTLIAYLVMLFIISYKLTLVSMLIIPFSGFVIARLVKNLKKQANESHISYGIMISYLEEALNGMRIIKGFNAEPFITGRFNGENIRYSNIIRSMAKRQQLASPVSEFLGILMVAGIVLYGGSLVLSGNDQLTGPSFIVYIALFSQILRPAKAISDTFANIHSGVAAGERVLSLIDEKPEIKDSPGAIDKKAFHHDLRFENVCFGYTERMVLDHISFTVPKGYSVALVGPSGGGKSTTMDLIPRFIEPVSGAIKIDGTDIKDIKIVSLRSLMGIVNQESILYNASVFANIAFGKPESSMEDVITAAKIANAHEFIMTMPEQYNSNIGDKGGKLSGGQKQRLCIARAVLTNPPIMLLDEATSSLDTESEKLVQDALNNLMKNRTSLIIAHRLSTIQRVNHILVMDNGRIVEEGSHDELIEKEGMYKKLIDMQTFITK